jgi:DNA gyrase subunit B
MRPLVEKGHIFIAQPPLYKVKRGKQEQYVKDDAELNSYLLNVAMEKAALHVNADAPAITGQALSGLAENYVRVMSILDRLSRSYDRNILEQMLYLPRVTKEAIEDKTFMSDWANRLQDAMLSAANGSGVRYSVELAAEDSTIAGLRIKRHQHGVDDESSISIHFFESPEYAQIAELATELTDLIGNGAYVVRGEQRCDIDSFKQAMEWLMTEARKGQAIQRYKGLGEMNPDQLWDTTVNPETRRLMQVRIEDAVAADEIFTTLMGDQVEPRREFIENNALAVENLDI